MSSTSRKQFPKAQWVALKPLIHQLYITEKRTIAQVTSYLNEHYGFNPTKKQFLRRITEWGFEKNVKQDERRAILESLGQGANEEGFQARMLRGRRLDKAKIERWKKREETLGGEGEKGKLASHGEVQLLTV
jgi:hypothetical protein